MAEKPRTIKGIKHTYALKEGEQWAIIGDKVVVIHPDHKPKIVHADGSIEEIDFK